MTLHCHLSISRPSERVSQLITGFDLLKRKGVVSLSQELRSPPKANDRRGNFLWVEVDGWMRCVYDMRDTAEVDLAEAASAHLYFKRTLVPSQIPADTAATCVALGLYYVVYPDTTSPLWMKCARFEPDRRLRIANSLRGMRLQPRFVPRVSNMCTPPDYRQEPRALFIARGWNPYDKSDRPQASVADRKAINDLRAECVVRLRQAFGQRFTGGLIPDAHTRQTYGNALLMDSSLAAKRRYLKLVRSHPVCVATRGLHGSTGRKFTEYLAFSRAVATEELQDEPPGGLEANTHYLSFDSAEQCVELVGRLFDNSELRWRLMRNSWLYFNSYVRPDAVVLRSLRRAAAMRDLVWPEHGRTGLGVAQA